MLLRTSTGALSRHGQSVLAPLFQASSLRPLASAPARIGNCHQRIQSRYSSSSNIPTLTPPWQFKDLPKAERRAFERFGPNYWERLPARDQEYARLMAEKRAERAAQFEEEFGSDWYAILEEATAIKDQAESAKEKEQLGDDKEYRKMDTKAKKALRQQFFDAQNATKTERLHAVMVQVAQNRAKF